MSDFNRFSEGSAPPFEAAPLQPHSSEAEPTPGMDNLPNHELRESPISPLDAREVANVQPDLGGGLHSSLLQRETSVDLRVSELVAEVHRLESEAQHIKQSELTHGNPLASIRHYCQGVANAIGAFFMAVFGHSEPKLTEHDARLAEISRKIGLDTQEMKLLQDTRSNYEELDKRLAGLEPHASPDHQNSISGAVDDLGLHSRTRRLFDSLIQPHGDLRGNESAVPLPDRPSSNGSESPLLPHGDARPWMPHTPSDLSPVTPPEVLPPGRESEPLPPANVTPVLDTPPWRAPIVTPHEVTPWREPLPPLPEATPGPLPEGVAIIGDQDTDTDNALVHPQGQNDYRSIGTCGVVTQEMILNRISGTHNFNENGLAHEAADRGWFDPTRGTPLGLVGNLCEAHGLHVEHRNFSSLDEMAQHLAKGEQVIAGVNAGKLGDAWASDPTAYGDGGPNHVVWVSGLRYETHNGVSQVVGVLIHDSGAGKSYELSAAQFQAAWSPSLCHAVYVSPGMVQQGA